MIPDRRRIEEELTGPGAAFEVERVLVGGCPALAYRQRPRSLRELIAPAAGRDGTHLIHGIRRYSFRDVFRQANAVSRSLRAAGVGPGDRVAVLSANNPEWVSTFWGTVDIGAILVGLNGWWSAEEAAYGLHDCGAKVLVADRPRYERVRHLLSGCPGVDHVYLIGECRTGDGAVRPFEDLVAEPGEELPDVPLEEDEPAVILYTSGTTARPKGAVHSHRAVLGNAMNIRFNATAGARAAGLDTPPPPTALVSVPFFHVSGCHAGFVSAMDRGSTVVIPEGRFDPERILALIETERVTQWSTVPTMVQRVVDHRPSRSYDLSSLAALAYGGAPSGEALQRRARGAFAGLRGMHTGYGLTETCGAVAVNGGAELDAYPLAAGRALPIAELRTDVSGEVLVRTSQLMTGYWPPGSPSPITSDGWLRTGDIGHLDADGRLFLTDRAKDIIIRGGENVHCSEIENRLVEHPTVAEAAVVGMPHPTLGEEVHAVVCTRPGAAADPEELRTWVAGALAHFKVPVHVQVSVEPLPRNAAGKLLKNRIRQSMSDPAGETPPPRTALGGPTPVLGGDHACPQRS